MILTVVVCLGLIGLDQLIKLLAVWFLAPVEQVAVIPGVVGLRYVQNTGAAFSLLSGRQPLLIVVTGVILLVGAYVLLFRPPKDRLERIAIVMIFSGGVGNLIDRLARGFVVDYIEVLFIRFAVFNFADCLVTLGFVLLVVAVFRLELAAARKRRAAGAGDVPAVPEEEALPQPDGEVADAGRAQTAEKGGSEPNGTD